MRDSEHLSPHPGHQQHNIPKKGEPRRARLDYRMICELLRL